MPSKEVVPGCLIKSNSMAYKIFKKKEKRSQQQERLWISSAEGREGRWPCEVGFFSEGILNTTSIKRSITTIPEKKTKKLFLQHTTHDTTPYTICTKV